MLRFLPFVLMLQAIWGRLLTTLYIYLRPMWKWLLRMTSGKCELLRITYQYPTGAQRTIFIEDSLRQSRDVDIKRLTKDKDTNIEAATVLVMKAKYIIPEIHSHFEGIFRQCLIQINGYIQLYEQVEDLRQTKYSQENPEHEKKLRQLWSILTNGEPLQSRTSSQWTEIGFQGNDPQTDFRGMGQLALDQLLYFSTRYTSVSRSLLTRSHHPKIGYSYAVVGINMTDLVYQLLKNRNLATHFYNLSQDRPSLDDFHEVYCYAFHEFDRFWFAAKPKNIMDFGKIRKMFRKKLISSLKQPNTVLSSDFQQASTSV